MNCLVDDHLFLIDFKSNACETSDSNVEALQMFENIRNIYTYINDIRNMRCYSYNDPTSKGWTKIIHFLKDLRETLDYIYVALF